MSFSDKHGCAPVCKRTDLWVKLIMRKSHAACCSRYFYLLYCRLVAKVKVKVKYPQGAFWRSRSLRWPYLPCPWSQALALCCWALHSLSYIPFTDKLFEMSPLKLTDSPFLYHQSYTILQGAHILPMAFTSCHERYSNLLPPDERAGALPTQPIRLVYASS